MSPVLYWRYWMEASYRVQSALETSRNDFSRGIQNKIGHYLSESGARVVSRFLRASLHSRPIFLINDFSNETFTQENRASHDITKDINGQNTMLWSMLFKYFHKERNFKYLYLAIFRINQPKTISKLILLESKEYRIF